jgi:hypothetical protein
MLLLGAWQRGLGAAPGIANKAAAALLSEKHEPLRFLPAIHRLGMDFIPVDDSSNDVRGLARKSPVEPVPRLGLALVRWFSTRLFDWL